MHVVRYKVLVTYCMAPQMHTEVKAEHIGQLLWVEETPAVSRVYLTWKGVFRWVIWGTAVICDDL